MNIKRFFIILYFWFGWGDSFSQTFIGYPLSGLDKYYYSSTNGSFVEEYPLYIVCEDGVLERILHFDKEKLSKNFLNELNLPREPIEIPDSVIIVNNVMKNGCYYPVALQFKDSVKLINTREVTNDDSLLVGSLINQNPITYEINGRLYCFEDKFKNYFIVYDLKLRDRIHDYMLRYIVSTENNHKQISFRLY